MGGSSPMPFREVNDESGRHSRTLDSPLLLEYMVKERNLSVHIQHSYWDATVLLLQFCAADTGKRPGDLLLLDVTPERVKAFLLQIKERRHCKIRTRNQRLFAIHSLVRFIESNSPEHIDWATKLRSIPSKRTVRKVLSYLEKPEMDAVLDAPDPNIIMAIVIECFCCSSTTPVAERTRSPD